MQAHEIFNASSYSVCGLTSASALAVKIDQDLVNEATILTFTDGSVLIARGLYFWAYTGEVLPQYTVYADSATGEWLTEPEFIGYVVKAEWYTKTDTDDFHFDIYEAEDQTRAILVIYQ